MADTINLKFLDLTGLGEYDTLIKKHIDEKVAQSLKGVALSEDGKKLLFYVDLPISEATPAYEIELPEVDISGFMEKFDTATAGHIVVVAEDGKTIVDSGKSFDGVALKADLESVQAAADDAKTKVEALEALVGVIPEGYEATTIVELIQEVANNIVENGYDDTELQAKVTALQEAIDKLNGDATVEGSVKNTFNLMLAEALAGADADFDTLIEMSNWLAEHADSAAEMNTQIASNKTAIDALTEYVGTLPDDATATNVVAYITEALENANLGQYAKASDLAAAIEHITQNETAIAVIDASLAEGGATYNQIVEAKKAGADAQTAVDTLEAYIGKFVSDDESVTTVVAYIDAKVTKVSADIENRLKVVEDAVTAINDEENGILAQAKTYTDELANGAVATNTADIIALQETVSAIEAIPTEDINALFEQEE